MGSYENLKANRQFSTNGWNGSYEVTVDKKVFNSRDVSFLCCSGHRWGIGFDDASLHLALERKIQSAIGSCVPGMKPN